MLDVAPVGNVVDNEGSCLIRRAGVHETPLDSPPPDHFVEQDGCLYAGRHLILDLWDARPLDDLREMESALRMAVHVCGATLLHLHLHHFTPSGGISGVAVLAESHISVHTWPERDFAAFDIFMCGQAQPERSIEVLQNAFSPARIDVVVQLRGRISK